MSRRYASIGEVADRLGLSRSSIRYYESEGLLEAPERIGGQRRFDQEAVARLGLIKLAQAAGFTLAEIKTLFDGVSEEHPTPRWRDLVGRKKAEIDRQYEELRRMRSILDHLEGCTCPTLQDCGKAALESGAWVPSR